MPLPNKIKDTERRLDSQAHSFQLLLHSLREQRPALPDPTHQLSPSETPLSQQQMHELPEASKQIYSQGAKSFYLPSHSRVKPQPCSGDPTLKNPHRYGHGNRYTMKQYQLPSHFFTPTKSKLQQHLQQSRAMSTSSPNPASPTHHVLFREGELASLHHSNALKPRKGLSKLAEVNSDLVLKYCMVNRLTPASDVEAILLFFVRMLELLSYALPQPNIEKYKDCLYFGPGKSKTNQEEGLLYFFRQSIYFGELRDHNMNGCGVQVFFSPPSIYRGEFRDGKMQGFFEVKTEGERYSGCLKDRLYHGHGKLTNDNGQVEGEFKEGILVFNSKLGPIEREFPRHSSMVEMPEKKRRRQQSNQSPGRVRRAPAGTSYEWSSSQMVPLQHELEGNPWSDPRQQKHFRRVAEKMGSSDMQEFSYPLGNELPEPSQASRVYRSRVRVKGHHPREDASGNGGWNSHIQLEHRYPRQPIPQKASTSSRLPRQDEWPTNFPQRQHNPEVRAPQASKGVGRLTHHLDSCSGQERPLQSKC